MAESAQTVFFIFVYPLVAVVGEKFVCPERGVHEAVDEGGGEVLTGRVHLIATERRPTVFQVRFVDVFRRLGFHDVQLQDSFEAKCDWRIKDKIQTCFAQRKPQSNFVPSLQNLTECI